MAARDLVTGISATALGVLAVSLAALEYHVSVETVAAGAAEGAAGLSRLSFGSGAYVVAYLGAGAILVALGVWKIYRSVRARRGRRAPGA